MANNESTKTMIKMEHAQIQGGDGPQVMTINGQQLQVLQMNSPHMIQGANGQQIVVHSIPTAAQSIQVAAPNNQQLQQIQVVPVSSLQAAGGNMPLQLLQTADGQTYLYQPTANAAQPTLDQHQILHHQSPAVINLNGNLVQLAGMGNAVQQQQLVNQPNIVMMVNGSGGAGGAAGGSGAGAGGGEGGATSAGGDEEPLLYVNARQYKRILKRRLARARLHELGKIPKERPKYLHESRHRHAMNRIRGEGGRFHSGSRKKMELADEESEDHKHTIDFNDMKPNAMAITIVHEDEEIPAPQWRRLAPQQSLPST